MKDGITAGTDREQTREREREFCRREMFENY